MRIPYGYVLKNNKIIVDENAAEVVSMVFGYYLTGASLGKLVDMLYEKNILSPTGNVRWTRAAIDKLLSNSKYIPIVGLKTYSDVQFEKERRCNVDYDKAGNPRKSTRYQSPPLEIQ